MGKTKFIYLLICWSLITVAEAQTHTPGIKFSSPCFKKVALSFRSAEGKSISGYSCEFVFVPNVYTESDSSGKVYYWNWWRFFLVQGRNYIDFYPSPFTNNKARLRTGVLSVVPEILYEGNTQTFQHKDFIKKFNTDTWEVDTITHWVKINRSRTVRYQDEFISFVNIEGWDLFVPEKYKSIEGYSLLYSNKRGFVGSYIYFFSKPDQTMPAAYAYYGDRKLLRFIKKRHYIDYFGDGISWQ